MWTAEKLLRICLKRMRRLAPLRFAEERQRTFLVAKVKVGLLIIKLQSVRIVYSVYYYHKNSHAQ